MELSEIEVGKKYWYTPYGAISDELEIIRIIAKTENGLIIDRGFLGKQFETSFHYIKTEYVPRKILNWEKWILLILFLSWIALGVYCEFFSHIAGG